MAEIVTAQHGDSTSNFPLFSNGDRTAVNITADPKTWPLDKLIAAKERSRIGSASYTILSVEMTKRRELSARWTKRVAITSAAVFIIGAIAISATVIGMRH